MFVLRCLCSGWIHSVLDLQRHKVQAFIPESSCRHTDTHNRTLTCSRLQQKPTFVCFWRLSAPLCSTLKWCNTVFIIYDWFAHHGDDRLTRLHIKTLCPHRETKRERQRGKPISDKRNTLYTCVRSVPVCLSVCLSVLSPSVSTVSIWSVLFTHHGNINPPLGHLY